MMQLSSVAGVTAGRTHIRYAVLLLVFIITTLNYADRATLSITGGAIGHAFGIGAVQMGYVFSAFSWAYVIAQLPGGWLLDRFGVRTVYATSIFLWSIFTLLQSTVGIAVGTGAAVVTLFSLRFLMGLAEAPAYPANGKVVASWFPESERGTATSIFNAAQYFAAFLFTPLMASLTHLLGWRFVYLGLGASGIILAFTWLKLMRDPAKHPRINQAELDYIQQGGAIMSSCKPASVKGSAAKDKIGGWRLTPQLLKNRMLLGVYLGQYCVNVMTYFFLTWFPLYLVQARGMTILQAGFVASIPAICGFVGGISGGLFSDFLIHRGMSLTIARKVPIIGGMLLSVSIIGCNYVSADWIVVALMALAFFGKGVGALGWAVVADTAPQEAIGLSGSIFNMFGNVAGIITPIAIGYIVSATHSFDMALIFVGAHAVITIFSYLFIVKDIHRVKLNVLAI